MRYTYIATLSLFAILSVNAFAADYKSHPPQRPLPQPIGGSLAKGPKLFVDATKGSDNNAGTEQAPWQTLTHALRQLKPGDTLYLRGGTYYEKVALTRSGTAESPIMIASYPGEMAIIDGSLREFTESPATSWEPLKGGAEGEYVSTKTYFSADSRRAPHQFLPGNWEPLWGIEEERPLALGHFADSMVPLHGYRTALDLRSTNEFWLGNKNEMRDTGLYGGPGLWFNRDTGRIHVRLAHHRLAGLGDRAYRGETDPRKLSLVVAAGFGDDVLRANGVRHVRLQGLVLRGATGSPMLTVYGSQNVELDHLTIFGGFPGLLINATQHLRVTNCALRGLAAPWTSRAHMKYRGTASYQIVLQNNQPINDDIELANCEFTDDHDFAFVRYATNLHFHHNFVDNFNDDGLECGAKLRYHTLYIHENRIGPCLMMFTQHEMHKDDAPSDHDDRTGLFVYRNVLDDRGGVYKFPPKESDPSGKFLHEEGLLIGDHGSPIWPVVRFYQNTALRDEPAYRGAFLFGMGSAGLQRTERDVFNNLFVQTDGLPGNQFVGVQPADKLHEGGNLMWGLVESPGFRGDLFAKFHASPLFKASQTSQPPGLTMNDRVADPKFVRLSADRFEPADLRLQADSPARRAGQSVPSDWPDPLRQAGADAPDIGAVPYGATPWRVGIDGRLSLFGGPAEK
jgi:hypothetical protein